MTATVDPRRSLPASKGEVSSRAIARQVGRLAVPVLIEQALLYLVGFSDTLLAGRYLEVEDLAAVTVSSYLLWFLGSLLMIVSAGATALVARMIGAGDREGAVGVCSQSIGLALIVGTVLAAFGFVTAPTIVGALGLSGYTATAAVLYLRIILVVLPLLACAAAGVACLRGAGDTMTGMWVMFLVNAINIAASWALVRGFGPLPAWGLGGIAAGTACGEGIGGLVILGILARGRSRMSLRLDRLVPRTGEVRRILRISLPAAGESGTNSLCQLWFLGLINGLGPVATAAHGVAIRSESIAFLATAAFAVAASTLTGQYLGAGRPDLASRAARTAWGISLATLAAIGLVLYLGAAPLFALFVGRDGSEVAALGVPVLRLVAFALPALTTINVLNGSLRGAGDTRWPWLIVVVGYLAVRLPLTAWLITPKSSGGVGWGLYGAWVAMFVDLHIRGILVAARFLQGGWRGVRV